VSDEIANIGGLRPVRVYSFDVFPRQLFEDSADEFYFKYPDIIDRTYEYGKQICSDPSQVILALVDDEKEVQGILWLRIDIIYNALTCVFVSVFPEYRNNSIAKDGTEFMKRIARKFEIDKLLGSTIKDTTVWGQLGWEPVKTRLIKLDVSQGE
jgi:hypothetical protein